MLSLSISQLLLLKVQKLFSDVPTVTLYSAKTTLPGPDLQMALCLCAGPTLPELRMDSHGRYEVGYFSHAHFSDKDTVSGEWWDLG